MKVPELTWGAGDPGPYDDDLLVDVIAGSIVLLIRGRNAWHSTWVRHYLRNATLYTDAPSAQGGAESKRAPGNVFYIVEAPALQLRGSISNVVVCDAHPDNPFGRYSGMLTHVQSHELGQWIGGIFPGVSVRDAVESLAPDSGYWDGPDPSEHSLRSGRLGEGIGISRSRRRLKSWKSESHGSGYRLGWRPTVDAERYTRRGTNALARRWTELLAGAEADALQGHERVHRLAGFRDHELGAMPKSLLKKLQQERAQAIKTALSQARDEWMTQRKLADVLARSLREARRELDAARKARLTPAETSQAIRAQRERVEVAEEQVAKLTREHAAAVATERALRDWYLRP
jgi:hypothetical protein